jgi:hypothetical protein
MGFVLCAVFAQRGGWVLPLPLAVLSIDHSGFDIDISFV